MILSAPLRCSADVLDAGIMPCPFFRPHGIRSRAFGYEATAAPPREIHAHQTGRFVTKAGTLGRVLTLIAVPANNERGPRYMEKALAAIHQAGLRHKPITLLYGSVAGQIGLFVRCPPAVRELVLSPIVANYPHCSVSDIEQDDATTLHTWSSDLELVPELFPILRHAQFEDMLNHNFADPVSSLLRAIKPEDNLHCRIEITCVPASHYRCHAARRAVRLLDREFFRRHHRLATYFARNITRPGQRWIAWLLGLVAWTTAFPSHTTLETSTSRLHEREEDLQAAADKCGSHLFETHIRLIVQALPENEQAVLDRLRSMTGALGAFTRSRLAMFRATRPRRGNMPHPGRVGFLLSHEELATLWHPPTSTAGAERMRTSDFAELEAPAVIHSEKEEGTVVLGRVRFRDDRRHVGLALEDRRRHAYIVGKTGMGKTTLIQNMIAKDMQAGRGVCVVDPHGDLAESIIGLVPRHRTNDVILFDAGSRDYAAAFNPLACRDPSRIDQVTSGVVSAFKKLHDSWGPRLEDTLRNAVFATVEQGGNLLSVMRLLGEKPYREQTVPRIRDDVVRGFWMHEFATWSDNYRTEAVAAIQNKIRPFLTNTNVRAIVSQPGRSLDLRQIMDEGQILIINLSKGRVGEDNSTLLGAFLVSSLQQAAMTRADVPEADRRDFFLYVDEFQNFTTGSFASVLSEARKFRLSLIVAHQYLAQLNDETASAVWGNVGSIVAFQVGSDDAELLALQLSKYRGQVTPEHLTGLPKYTAYARLLIDGLPSPPFSLQTLPPPTNNFDSERAEIIRRVSRRRFLIDMQSEPKGRSVLTV